MTMSPEVSGWALAEENRHIELGDDCLYREPVTRIYIHGKKPLRSMSRRDCTERR